MVRILIGIIAALLAMGAARAAPSMEAYGRLPGIDLAAVSPSGERYALIGAVGKERHLVVLEGGKLLVNAVVSDRKVRDLRFAGEDKVLIYSTEIFGLSPRMRLTKYEIGELLVLDLNTNRSFQVLSKGLAGNGVHGLYGVRQEEGRWYAYVGGIRFARSVTSGGAQFRDMNTDLYKVDLDTNREKLVDENDAGNVIRSWAVGEQGGLAAIFSYDKRGGGWRLRAKDGPALASGVDELGEAGIAGLGRTADTVFYRERDEYGEDAWYEVPLNGSEKLLLFRGIRIAEQYRDPNTGVLIGYRRDSDRPNLRFFHPDRQAALQAAQLAFPKLNMRLKSWNNAFDRLVVQTDGPGDPGTWWLVDTRTGKANEIGRSYPTIRSAEVGEVDVIGYKAADGLDISAVLTLPPGREAKNLPLIVLPHDEGGRDYPQFHWIAQAFASRGYAVLQPNYRGSEGYGADFLKAGDGEWGAKVQTDLSDGVAELARRGIADPKRACIVGAGFGGYAALAGVTLQQGLYRCAVSINGFGDLTDFQFYTGRRTGYTGPEVRGLRQKFGGEDQLIPRSPIRHAARADAPILLLHGDKDTIVPPDFSRSMAGALRTAGKPVEHVVLKGDDHWLSLEDARIALLTAAIGFVERHNAPD